MGLRGPGIACVGLLTWACVSAAGNSPDPGAGEVRDEGSEGMEVPMDPGETGGRDPDGGGEDPGTPPSPGGCGLAPYRWRTPPEVGRLIAWEEDPMWAQPREVLEDAVIAAGFGTAAPLTHGSRIYRIRYWTQDRGELMEATGLVAVPQPDDGGPGPWPWLLSFHWTTGMSDACAPSRSIEGCSLAAIWAASGYLTVAPDYLGMNGLGAPSGRLHPYLVGEPTAIAAWDALRAAEELLSGLVADEPARPADRRVVLWGASQGGHGALFGKRLARWYAPEYEVVTVVASTPPADLWAETRSAILDDREGLPNVAAFLVAAADWYRGNQVLNQVLTDDPPSHFRQTFPQALRERCDFWTPLSGFSARDVFLPAFRVALEQGEVPEPLRCMLEQNSLSRTTIPPGEPIPTLFILAENDTLVNVESERQAFLDLCRQGEALAMLQCRGAAHQQGSIWSLGEQKRWMAERLAGIPATDLCRPTEPLSCGGMPASGP